MTGLASFREPNWLDASRTRNYLAILALANLTMLGWIVATSRGGVHATAQREVFENGRDYAAFFYPPFFLPFCVPLGWVSYFWALAGWLAVGGAAFAYSVRQWLRVLRISRPLWLLLAAFPPVAITITHGQTSFLVAALLGGGALLVRERPITAGVLFGLAAIKPQFGVLVPLVLVLTGEWRTIVAAAATVIALAAAVTLAWGPALWGDWLAVTAAAQAALEQGAVGFGKMQGPFAGARLLGASIGAAYAVQALVAAVVLGTLAASAWRRRYDLTLGATMLAGAPLITPFMLDYDLLILAYPLMLVAGTGFRPWEKVAVMAAFVLAALRGRWGSRWEFRLPRSCSRCFSRYWPVARFPTGQPSRGTRRLPAWATAVVTSRRRADPQDGPEGTGILQLPG